MPRAPGPAAVPEPARHGPATIPMLSHAVRLLLLALLVGTAPIEVLCAQAPAGRPDEGADTGPVEDPYTKGDAEAMRALGIERYAPFPWADFKTTADVDKVLGERRVRWLETRHFRLGCTLATAPLPQRPDERKALQAETKELNRLCRKIPARPKELDTWLRLHLFAQRCERAYAEFERLLGHSDADFEQGKVPGHGPYLGMPDKFLLLLFQKKSDMVRYMDRFCGRQDDASMRFYHQGTNQLVLCVSAEGLEGFTESGLHGHVVYATWQNLLNGYRGYNYPLPPWLAEGLAHWYSRQVPTEFLNVQLKDDESVAQDDQYDWPKKVRRRAQHEGAFFPFATMAGWSDADQLGYHGHAQSWSRVDYLMHVDPEKVGELVRQLKGVAPTGDFERQGAEVSALAQKLLVDLFGLDAATFDERWRAWVLKAYPK